MARHLYVDGEGLLLAVVDRQADHRVHVAWSQAQAGEWWSAFEHEEIPTSDGGQAISEAGMAALIGSAKPGDSGEIEAVPAEKPAFSGIARNPNPRVQPESADQQYHFDDDPAPVEKESADDVDDNPDLDNDGDLDNADVAAYRLGPKGLAFIACMHPETGFRSFLDQWQFLDKDASTWRVLGQCLWPGQEEVVEKVQRHRRVYELKARQLGETTLAVAYDGYVMRFRGHGNTRNHLVSRTEELAKRSLLTPMKAGLRRLPDYMRLPESQDTTTIYELEAGPNDHRISVAYSAKEPGRGETCSHLHLDEWAAMMETAPELPKEVWAAAEPSISKVDGTAHILTTGVGPEGYYAEVWIAAVELDPEQYGPTTLVPCFIKATGSRPDYTEEFLRQKKLDIADDSKFAHEYPDRWEDALAGAGDVYFGSALCDEASNDARPFSRETFYVDARTGKRRRRKFIKAWDIAGDGEKSDAVVCVVLDLTTPIWDVVHYERHTAESYPTTAYRIEQVHAAFPGPTWIEDNNAGKAVRQFLSPSIESEVFGHNTTRQSKPAALAALKYALQDMAIKWHRESALKLDSEMRVYRLDDAALQQDCVMALSIAAFHGPEAAAEAGGKILKWSDYTV